MVDKNGRVHGQNRALPKLYFVLDIRPGKPGCFDRAYVLFFRVGNQHAECEKQQVSHEEFCFDIYPPLTGGCSEGLGAF